MPAFLGFGNAQNGIGTLTGTQAPVDSTITVTSGSTSATCQTGKSFAVGDMVCLHQSIGTGVGTKELNIVAAYNSGTGALTLQFPAGATYGTGAQIIQVLQRSSIVLSGNFKVKDYDGSVGGFMVLMAQGDIDGAGLILNCAGGGESGGVGASVGGYRGGNGSGANINLAAGKGEGTTGSTRTAGTGSADQRAAQGNGGGGTAGSSVFGNLNIPSSGGGGGNGTAGSNGGSKDFAGWAGTGGSTAGSSDLSTMVFGGGGGGCDQDSSAPGGSSGGGCLWIICGGKLKNITINVKGGVSTNLSASLFGGTASGGAGAGGSALVHAVEMESVTFQAIGGTAAAASWPGGAGGNGRVAYYTCKATSITSDVTPSATVSGQDFCQSFIHIF